MSFLFRGPTLNLLTTLREVMVYSTLTPMASFQSMDPWTTRRILHFLLLFLLKKVQRLKNGNLTVQSLLI